MFIRILLAFMLCFTFLPGIARSQSTPLICATSAVPTLVHGEGTAERVGDILLSCSGGTPGAVVTGNLTVFLNVAITNHLSAAGSIDAVLTVDTGSGPVRASVPGVLISSSSVSYNGLTFTVPASQNVSLRLTNLRGAVSTQGTPFGTQRPIFASIAFNGPTLPSNTSQVIVAFANVGLLASYASTGVRCVGSPLPTVITYSNLFLGGTRFFSTRLTEGYGESFLKKDAFSDTGTRFLIRYSGFPSGARLFVPDVVAGSDAVQPTAAGDFGLPPSGGAYVPGDGGSLLLARVRNTDASGVGGNLSYGPGPIGSGTVAFDSAGEVTLTNGAGVAVYEVVDSNPSLRESAQFPTFIGLPATTDGSSAVAFESVSLAPVSTVTTATATDPVPRFAASAPPPDCSSLQDCNASYFPKLFVGTSAPLQFTAFAGSAFQTRYVQVNNRGGGILNWTASIIYKSGAGWLTADPTSGINNGTVRIDALPSKVPAGTYQATLLIDAGPFGGNVSLPITLTVTNFPPPPVVVPPNPPVVIPTPTVLLRSLTNAARPDYAGVSAGSLAIIKGSNLQGKDVSVSFDGVPASILSATPDQIQVQLPAALPPKASTQLVVTVDGNKSAPLIVAIKDLAPAIFPDGVLNSDNSTNSEASAALVGTSLQVFSTGLLTPQAGPITVKLHDRFLSPLYSGPLSGSPGVDQVNVAIPEDLPAMTTEISVCGYSSSNANEPACSLPVKVTLRQ